MYDLLENQEHDLKQWLNVWWNNILYDTLSAPYEDELEIIHEKPDSQMIVEALFHMEKLKIEVNTLHIPAILQKNTGSVRVSDDFFHNQYTTEELKPVNPSAWCQKKIDDFGFTINKGEGSGNQTSRE